MQGGVGGAGHPPQAGRRRTLSVRRNDEQPHQRSRWVFFSGLMTPAWRSLAIAGLTLATQNGVFSAFPVLYIALLDEFPWSRAETASIQSLAVLLLGLATPATGWLLDRFGPQRLFPLAAVILALGLAGASQGQFLWQLYLGYGVIAAIGHSALSSTPNMVVVSKWFGAARGRAIALADLGTGLGQALFVPGTQILISHIGWRDALLTLAVLLALLLVPLNRLQRFPPEGAADSRGVTAPSQTWTVARAVRTVAFWALVVARFASGLAFNMMSVHVVAFLVGLGYSKMFAASAYGSMSLVSMVGRVLVGVISDRLGREVALTLAFASTAAGIGMLLALQAGGAPVLLGLAVLFYGVSKGSSGIVTLAKAADLYQGPRLATIAGWITIASGMGEALGTWFGGFAYDRTGGYVLAFLVTLAALGVGITAMWVAGITGRRLCPQAS